MKVQSKILILLLAVLTVFIVFLYIFFNIRNKQDHIIAEEKREQQKINIKSILQFRANNLVETVHDYAVWNEMVDFVKTKDKSWARDNLHYILRFYHIDAVWVFNNSGELVYHINKAIGYKNKVIEIPLQVLQRVNKLRPFLFHIPLHPNVMQVCGSTIHLIDDINRLTEPKGYILMGKVWDDNYLNDLSKLTNTKIMLKNRINKTLTSNTTDFINTSPLFDWNGKKILDILFIRENPFLSRLNDASQSFLFYIIILAIIILSMFFIAFHKFVKVPLGIITESLDKDNIEILIYDNTEDEFGQIANLIRKFYVQKQSLAQQIIDNINKTIALEVSERNFRSFIEQSSDGISIFDNTGSVIECNTAIVQKLQTTPDQMMGKKLWDLQYNLLDPALKSKENYESIKKRITDWLNTNTYLEGGTSSELTLHLSDGKVIYATQSIFPIKAGDRNLIGSILTDITEMKIAEMKIKEALEKEKELHDLKTHFIATVSHEFRTPMTIIYSNLQLLEVLKDNPVESAKCSKRIFNAIKQMTNILDEVNLVNKDFAGKLGFNPSEVYFEDFCNQLVEEASSLNKKIHVDVIYKAAVENIVIDPNLVQYIILNLLSNAIKFSKDGATVCFRINAVANILELIIEDQGIGISEHDLLHIFEPFHRGLNVENIKGTGLGLSIVKRSIEIHKGEIEVKSILCKGTTIKVLIPFVKLQN